MLSSSKRFKNSRIDCCLHTFQCHPDTDSDVPRTQSRVIIKQDVPFLQQQPNCDKLSIGYWGKSLSALEKSYSIAEKKCLTVVWSIFTLRPYICGDTATLRKDHYGVKWILSLANSSGRQTRSSPRLVEYDYKVEYRLRETRSPMECLVCKDARKIKTKFMTQLRDSSLSTAQAEMQQSLNTVRL